MISVIVPVYNVEQYVARCLESLINQTYKQIEIIVVNDGSTDNSLEIINEYKQKDCRIKVIDKPNGGLSSSRNAGLDIASGEFVTFLDSDDWLELTAYEEVVRVFDKYEDADLVIFKNKVVHSEKDILNSVCKSETVMNGVQMADFIFGTFKTSPSLSCCNKVYRRDKISGVKFLEGRQNEDILFNYMAIKQMRKAVILDVEYYHYYQREGSISWGKVRKKSFDSMYMWDLVSEDSENMMRKNIIKLNKTKDAFSLLLRAATFGFDESFADCNEYKKKYMKFFRKNIGLLLRSKRLNFKKRIAAIILYCNFNLSGKITKKILGVKNV